MKLKELKAQVYDLWQSYINYHHRAVVQSNQFKADIRREFGDLRCRNTWEKAFCRYSALHSRIGLLDADRLIWNDFNFTPDRDDYPYRYRIFEEWLSLPEGLDRIKTGLEILFRDYTREEREDANGFLELVQEQRAAGKLAGVPIGLIGSGTTR
ncbi:MAG: hypothetical protein AAFY26_00805 [Cyanobacteria bacterium J06638_22]